MSVGRGMCSAWGLAVSLVIAASLLAQGPGSGSNAPARTLRDAIQGEWKPTLLPPNDLTDPPQRYPDSPGGTCVGICAVTYALWACPRDKGWQSPEGCAVRIIHSLIPNDQGRFANHPLPTHLRMGEDLVPLEDRRALVRLSEIIQNALQPGGGLPKTREMIDRIDASLRRDPARIRTSTELHRHVDRNGGRLILILVDVSADHTRMSGHAVIVTSEDGRLVVWDPNAKRGDDVLGSGRPAPLDIDEEDDGGLESLSYQATLPDGTTPTRRFGMALPVSSVATPDRLRLLPPLR